jgi:hypothetical protein
VIRTMLTDPLDADQAITALVSARPYNHPPIQI